jgi:hypothetical protein
MASKGISIFMSIIGLVSSLVASYLLYDLVKAPSVIWLLFGVYVVTGSVGFILMRIPALDGFGKLIGVISTAVVVVTYYHLFNFINADPGMWIIFWLYTLTTFIAHLTSRTSSLTLKSISAMIGVIAFGLCLYNGYLIYSFVVATTLMWCLFWVGNILTFFGAVIYVSESPTTHV